MTDPQASGSAATANRDHWRRFRRLMLLMMVLAIVTAAVAVGLALRDGVPFHLHFVLAMGGGIVLSLLLAGALMGLVFVSNRSGHDDDVGDQEGRQEDLGDDPGA